MQLARRYPEIARRGGEVVFIASEEEDRAGLEKTLRRHHPPFPVVMDGAMGSLGISKRYSQRSTFLIDRQGRIAWSYRGSTHVRPKGDTILRAFLRHSLEQEPARTTEQLISQLASGSDAERGEAAILLGAMPETPASAIPGLRRLLRKGSDESRNWAIFALGGTTSADGARGLVAALGDSVPRNRVDAISALREFGNPFNDWQGRYADRSVLREIRGELRGALERAASDEDQSEVAAAARDALRELRKSLEE